MKHWHRMLVCVVLLILGIVAVAPFAHAADPAPAPTASQTSATTPKKCDQYVGLSNRIAGCIRATVDEAADRYFKGFYGVVKKAIGGAMTLAVIFYGVALAYGMVEKVGRDSMVLLLKIACVAAFTTSSPTIYGMVTKIMDGGALAAISYVPVNGKADAGGSDFSQAACMKLMTSEQNKSNQNEPSGQKKVVGPWLAMDCLVDSVIGIKILNLNEKEYNEQRVYWNKTLDAAKQTADELRKPVEGGAATSSGADLVASTHKKEEETRGLSRGLIHFFFSGMQTSTVGLILAVIGFVFIWGLLILMIKALYTYLAGYIGIALMVILSPLFIPLVLFKQTKNYFDKWVRTVISMALSPILLMVFITFAIAAVDFATFSGKYSIWYRIAGDATTKDKFSLNEYLTVVRREDGSVADANNAEEKKKAKAIITENKARPIFAVKTDNPTNLKPTSRDEGGKVSGLKYSDCTPALIALDKTGALKQFCSFQYNVSVLTSYLDWELMAKARTPKVVREHGATSDGQQIAREVLAAAMFCAFVVYIMNGLLSVLPFMAQDITGDAGQSVNLMSQVGSGFGGGSKTMDEITAQVKKITGGR